MKSGVAFMAVAVALSVGACGNRTDQLMLGEGTAARSIRVAGAALAGGLPQAALNATRAALERDPDNVQALMQQADALTSMGRMDAAAEAYKRVLSREASPTREQARQARLGVGRAELAAGRAVEAEATYRELLAIAPKEAAGHSGLGIALDLQGRHADAQAAYRVALAQTDSDATRANLGLSLAMAGDAAGAVALLRPLAADPAASPRVRHNLAFALAQSGDRTGAERALAVDMPREQVVVALSGFNAFRAPQAAAVVR